MGSAGGGRQTVDVVDVGIADFQRHVVVARAGHGDDVCGPLRAAHGIVHGDVAAGGQHGAEGQQLVVGLGECGGHVVADEVDAHVAGFLASDGVAARLVVEGEAVALLHRHLRCDEEVLLLRGRLQAGIAGHGGRDAHVLLCQCAEGQRTVVLGAEVGIPERGVEHGAGECQLVGRGSAQAVVHDGELAAVGACHGGCEAQGDGHGVLRGDGLRGQVEGLVVLGHRGGEALRGAERGDGEGRLSPVVDAELSGERRLVGASEVHGGRDARRCAPVGDIGIGADEREVGVGHDAQCPLGRADGCAVAEGDGGAGLVCGSGGVCRCVAEGEALRHLGAGGECHGLGLGHLLSVDVVGHGVGAGCLVGQGDERQAWADGLSRLHLVVLSHLGDVGIVGHGHLLESEQIVESHAVECEGHVVVAGLGQGDAVLGKVVGEVGGREGEHGVAPCLSVGAEVDLHAVGLALLVAGHLEGELLAGLCA